MGQQSGDGPIGMLSEDATTVPADSQDTAVITGSPADVYAANPAIIIVTAPSTLRTALTTGTDIPIVPLGFESSNRVTASGVSQTIESIQAGDYQIKTVSALSVAVGDRSIPTLFDVTLMTDEPARISEYGISLDQTAASRTVRADGVVIATPLGSSGYAAAAGGPEIIPGTNAVTVVPVAPFAVDRPSWAVSPPVETTVRRDEGTVTLFADGESVQPVEQGESVTVTWGESVSIGQVSTPDKKT